MSLLLQHGCSLETIARAVSRNGDGTASGVVGAVADTIISDRGGAAMTELPPILSKLIPRLASDHDGEVVATVRAIDRALRTRGADWHDLAATVLRGPNDAAGLEADRECSLDRDDRRAVVNFCSEGACHLSSSELGLMWTLKRWRGEPTDRQFAWLLAIADRLGYR
jgi:hypothetical protein